MKLVLLWWIPLESLKAGEYNMKSRLTKVVHEQKILTRVYTEEFTLNLGSGNY